MLFDGCGKVRNLNAVGSDRPAFCKKHALHGMVDRRCLHDGCPTFALFSVTGKSPNFGREHAEDGMVNVNVKRCIRGGCMKSPSFNVAGVKTPVLCGQHIKAGMVNILSRCCSHETCTKNPSPNFAGIKAAVFCGKHAEEGMVNIHSKRCLHDGCNKHPSFNVLGKQQGSARHMPRMAWSMTYI